ncbi:MAG: choice-of-anchor J domain-containing protein, partial [Bacteroidales bacterium]|nr:choice-of-anchor J domain-containing protein [Bacteroidales bacterium]
MKNRLLFVSVLLFILAMSTNVFAQATHTLDFETPDTGSGWSWTVFEFAPTIAEIPNPVSGGINTSPTVMEFVAHASDQPWAGCWTADDGEFTFDANNAIVKIMVYKPVISNVGIKFEGPSAPIEIQVPNTVTDAWEELTFDFSGVIGNTYNKIVLFPDFAARTVDHTCYFDNIEVPDGVVTGPLPEPTVAAPDPTQNAADVISVYSDAYTDIAGTNFNPGWGQSTVVTFEDIGGNEMMKYDFFNYQGIEFAAAQDLSAMTYLHIDMWTPNATDVQVTPISATTGELLQPMTPINLEDWNSYDIPLADFTGVSMADIIQMKFDGQGGVNPSVIYLDNIYYYTSTAPPGPTVAAPDPTQNAADVVSIYSDTYTDLAGTNFNPGWGQTTIVTFEDIGGNEMMKYDVFNYQGTELAAPQDLTGMDYMHVDMWTSDATVVKVTPISATTGEMLVSMAPITSGSWNSYDIPVGDFTGVSMADIFQLKFDGQEGVTPSTIYLDNIYFYSTGTTNLTLPVNEGFEGGSIPNGWSIDYSVGTVDWTVDSGGHSGNPAAAHSGTYNALFYGGSYNGNISWLISPEIDAAAATDLNLSFWHAQTVWAGDQDELKVHYRISGTDPWVELAHYVDDIPDWVEETLSVPGGSSNLQIAFEGIDGYGYGVCLDDIYLDENVITGPTVAAPDPTQNAADVISIYSDSYTDIAGTNFNPGWGQTTIVTFENIGGNEMMKYDVFNYQGTELAGSQDLSSMDYMHVDMWTMDATIVKVTPISATTGEFLVSLDPINSGTWNSYDIPLSDFTGVSMADIFQLKFDGQEGVTPSTIYIDNIYFYEDATTNPFDPPENVSIDATTAELTWTPPAATIAEDNFDSYTPGDYLAVVNPTLWTTWSNAPGGSEDVVVSDAQSNSPDNSILVELNNDLVMIMNDYMSGVYSFDLDMYVPSGYCGYYNLQKTSTPGDEWAF